MTFPKGEMLCVVQISHITLIQDSLHLLQSEFLEGVQLMLCPEMLVKISLSSQIVLSMYFNFISRISAFILSLSNFKLFNCELILANALSRMQQKRSNPIKRVPSFVDSFLSWWSIRSIGGSWWTLAILERESRLVPVPELSRWISRKAGLFRLSLFTHIHIFW